MKEQDKPLLSKQEINILGLISKGFTSEMIGQKLAIARSTVQTHIWNKHSKTFCSKNKNSLIWHKPGGIVPLWGYCIEYVSTINLFLI